jgi:hypothetical protein
VRSGIMFIGCPGVGHGTGFVISKEPRLVATNAHVADIFQKKKQLFAYRNGAPGCYKVKRIWYHPGVERLPNRGLIIRSTDPRDGPVFTWSPDVAVLELDKDDSAFPDALPLASAREIEDLFGVPVGMVGFPGHDNTSWPSGDEPPAATFHEGMISRVTDFNLDPNASGRLRQFVQHTAQGFGGFSGSPLFTADGSVVAIHNSSRHDEDRGRKVTLNHGIRVDVLWELIAHHHLERMIPLQVARERLSVERYLRPDPTTQKFRRAQTSVVEARKLMARKGFAQAIDACTDAIQEMPNFGLPYKLRSISYREECVSRQRKKSISQDERLNYNGKALADANRYCELCPDDPRGYLTYALALTNYGNAKNQPRGVRKDYSHSKKAITLMTKLINIDEIENAIRAEAYYIRGVARAHSRDRQGAYADISQAIRLRPRPVYYRYRAAICKLAGRADMAEEDLQRARELEANVQA